MHHGLVLEMAVTKHGPSQRNGSPGNETGHCTGPKALAILQAGDGREDACPHTPHRLGTTALPLRRQLQTTFGNSSRSVCQYWKKLLPMNSRMTLVGGTRFTLNGDAERRFADGHWIYSIM